MASRIATSSLRASTSLLRPYAGARLASRALSTSSMRAQKPPSERASEILEKVPSSSGLITKTGTVVLGTGALATAISQELYVMNEETIVVIGFLIILSAITKAIRTPYKEWAEGHINRIKTVLETSRSEHTQAVKDRISSVGQLRDVVDVTKGLFALSKETAQLEAESFALRQQVNTTAELKSVLDSWVRYEQQVKESEQADLTKSVIDKVFKSIQDEKTQREILANAVAEVEQLVKAKAI
ncbi:ATP synthase [Ramaria rubella]|nr:ATP synthase [Ramaria rubella]